MRCENLFLREPARGIPRPYSAITLYSCIFLAFAKAKKSNCAMTVVRTTRSWLPLLLLASGAGGKPRSLEQERALLAAELRLDLARDLLLEPRELALLRHELERRAEPRDDVALLEARLERVARRRRQRRPRRGGSRRHRPVGGGGGVATPRRTANTALSCSHGMGAAETISAAHVTIELSWRRAEAWRLEQARTCLGSSKGSRRWV